MSEKTGVFIIFWAAPGRGDDLLALILSMYGVVKTEAGTLAYGVHKVAGDREGVAVYELYGNAASQSVHGESDAVNVVKSQLGALLAAPPEVRILSPVAGAKGLPF